MTDYIRRLVSGNKARFRDHILNLELDLVYVTDKIIIMGYPAVGVEGLYRNRREDALKFLKHRHGKNFWVFNFCPVKENSYDASVFEGRVSRYPFPDHHAPPLAIMPLIAREINEWLKGSPDRVAVLHCKAGKGRSGTMACTYLLSIDDLQAVQPPRLERSHSAKEWASKRMHDTVAAVSANVNDTVKSPEHSPPGVVHSTALRKSEAPSDSQGILDIDTGRPQDAPMTSPLLLPTGTANPERSFTDALKGVLDLHTARRMKPADSADKIKQGVSIPSQRRYLYYWALLLAHDAPRHLWAVEPPLNNPGNSSSPSAAFQKSKGPRPKVRLTNIKLRMRESSSVKMGVVKAASMVIAKTKLAKGPGTPLVRPEKDALSPSSSSSSSSSASSLSSDLEDIESKEKKEKTKSSARSQVWASIARYDDEFVERLEDWEVHTRDLDGKVGQRRPGSEHWQRENQQDEDYLSDLFKDDRWDKGKMVRSFARMGDVDGTSHQKAVDDELGNLDVYNLQLLSDKRWESLKSNLKRDEKAKKDTLKVVDDQAKEVGVSHSEANSVNDLAATLKHSIEHSSGSGLILDAGREVRIKLYLGQVFMGWLWFIPTFHMPQPPPEPSNEQRSADTLKGCLLLTKKDLDFPLGIGSAIVDVVIEMEWVVPTATNPTGHFEPPVDKTINQGRQDSEPGQSQLATVVQAVIGDAGAEVGGVRAALEGKQGVET